MAKELSLKVEKSRGAEIGPNKIFNLGKKQIRKPNKNFEYLENLTGKPKRVVWESSPRVYHLP